MQYSKCSVFSVYVMGQKRSRAAAPHVTIPHCVRNPRLPSLCLCPRYVQPSQERGNLVVLQQSGPTPGVAVLWQHSLGFWGLFGEMACTQQNTNILQQKHLFRYLSLLLGWAHGCGHGGIQSPEGVSASQTRQESQEKGFLPKLVFV